MNIGLILSGGMAKGAYQIGVLKALNEFIPLSEIKYISCASIGVLNGYAYATENLPQAEQMWRSLCNNDSRYFINQIVRSSMLQQNISTLYDESKKLPTTFYSTLLDWGNKTIVYKDLSSVPCNEIPLYLKASVAIPLLNHAVPLDNTSYYDGAFVDYIPVYPLLKHNLDYVICVYFDDVCYKFEDTYFDNKVIKIAFPSDGKLRQSLVFSQQRIDDMIKSGYERTKYILKTVLAEGYDNLDHIYHTIDFLNQNNTNKKLRLTVDVLATNFNKVTQRLTKRKIR